LKLFFSGGIQKEKGRRLSDGPTWDDMPGLQEQMDIWDHHLTNTNHKLGCEPGSDYKLM